MKKMIILLIASTTVEADPHASAYQALQLIEMEQQTIEMERMNKLLQKQLDASRQAQKNTEWERSINEAELPPSRSYVDQTSNGMGNQNCISSSRQVQQLNERLNQALDESANAKEELLKLKKTIEMAENMGAHITTTGVIYFTDADACLPNDPCANR